MRIEPKNPPPPVNFQVRFEEQPLLGEIQLTWRYLTGYFVSVLLQGMGRLSQNSLCEEEQNPQCRFQVSVLCHGTLSGWINWHWSWSFSLLGLLWTCRSSAVEQLLEKNYRIHCSVHNVVSHSFLVHMHLQWQPDWSATANTQVVTVTQQQEGGTAHQLVTLVE